MITFSDDAVAHIKDVELESQAIMSSFENTLKQYGSNTYKPFAVFFTDPETKAFVVISRDVENEQDYFTAISEMLFAYSSVSATAVLFSIDVSKQINGEQTDVLEIYLATDHFCYVYSYPYHLDESNNFTWKTEHFNVVQIEDIDKVYSAPENANATMEIIEALYLHVTLRQNYFEFSKLKSFFDYSKFEYIDLTKDLEKNSSPV